MTTSTRCRTCGYDIASPGAACPRCLAALVDAEYLNDPTDAVSAPHGVPDPGALRAVAEQVPGLAVLERIGRGGMGVVFRARQSRLGRPVALKLLALELADQPALVRRFETEARAMAALSHPGIVTIHDFGVIAGHPYLVMEFIDGPSLREVLARGPLPPAEALRLAGELCTAAHFAHVRGVVHRDLKPENILLGRDGRVKIADFGLAKLTRRFDATLTQSHAVLGTPRYMAPEQWEDPRDADSRSDVFAVGVILYEMLTGQLPVGRFELPSASSAVGPRLDEVVLRALDQAPERRFQTADDMSMAISLASSPGAPSVARAAPAPAPVRSPLVQVELVAKAKNMRTLRVDLPGAPSKVLTYVNDDEGESISCEGQTLAETDEHVDLVEFVVPTDTGGLRCIVQTKLHMVFGNTLAFRLIIDGHLAYEDGDWGAESLQPPAPTPPTPPHVRAPARTAGPQVELVSTSTSSRLLRLDLPGEAPKLLKYVNTATAERVELEGELLVEGGGLLEPAYLMNFALPTVGGSLPAIIETRLDTFFGTVKSVRLTVDGQVVYGDGEWAPDYVRGPSLTGGVLHVLAAICRWFPALAGGAAAFMAGCDGLAHLFGRPGPAGLVMYGEPVGYFFILAGPMLMASTATAERDPSHGANVGKTVMACICLLLAASIKVGVLFRTGGMLVVSAHGDAVLAIFGASLLLALVQLFWPRDGEIDGEHPAADSAPDSPPVVGWTPAKRLLLGLYGVGVLCLLSFSSEQGSAAWSAQLGWPWPWMEAHSGPGGFGFGLVLSWQWLIAAATAIAYGSYWQLDREEGRWLPPSHLLVIGIALLLPLLVISLF